MLGLVLRAAELERADNAALPSTPLLFSSAEVPNGDVEDLTDRRLEELGFDPHFGTPTRPAGWPSTWTRRRS